MQWKRTFFWFFYIIFEWHTSFIHLSWHQQCTWKVCTDQCLALAGHAHVTIIHDEGYYSIIITALVLIIVILSNNRYMMHSHDWGSHLVKCDLYCFLRYGCWWKDRQTNRQLGVVYVNLFIFKVIKAFKKQKYRKCMTVPSLWLKSQYCYTYSVSYSTYSVTVYDKIFK